MPLPTTQPVDWPDWGAVPTFTTQLENIPTVAPTDDLLLVEVGYFSHCLLMFAADGDGTDWTVKIQQLTGSPSEGFSVANEQFVTRLFGQNIVVPMTLWTPWIRVRDELASSYPHNALIYVTLFSAWGVQTGYPGGMSVIQAYSNPGGGATSTFNPNGCAPGQHSVALQTDGTTWDLFLRIYSDYATYSDILLADETTPTPYDIEFIAPPSGWKLLYTNNDAGAHNIAVNVNRLP